MAMNMVAKHAIWPKESDPIFAIAGKAGEAAAKYGKENVINATLGALADDDGNLICMKTVYDELKALPNALIAAYAGIEGQPEFLAAVQRSCFGKYAPDAYTRAIATPGGTGSIRHAIFNYTDEGDQVLVCDWYWTPYQTISEEYGRSVHNYTLFDEAGNFNLESFKKEFNYLMDKQKRVVTIINTPAHNPTGYSLSDEEWDAVLAFLKDVTKDPEKKAILFVDCAYIDFAGEGDERRAFFKKFSHLPENILVIVGFSMSKGYTMYGLRSGAAIGISSNEDIVEEFFYASAHSNRANWSNGTRSAMEVMIAIDKDPAKLAAYEAEKLEYKQMLRRRAKAFEEGAKEAGLNMLPYRDGFFTSIPHKDPMALVNKLAEKNLFAVPLAMGVRFAVCAVEESKCRKAPAIIQEAIEELGGK